MYRSHTCGELRSNHVGNTVTLAGWVQTVRKFGSITFVDLRDRYGITQLLFGEELNKVLDENPLGREFVLQATGTVSERSNKNTNIATGDIEILITEFKVLNKSAVPPFTIQDDTDGGDDLRCRSLRLAAGGGCPAQVAGGLDTGRQGRALDRRLVLRHQAGLEVRTQGPD